MGDELAPVLEMSPVPEILLVLPEVSSDVVVSVVPVWLGDMEE